MKTISGTKELEDFCRRLAANEYVCVDTEFMREGTFWPQLCLIQLAGGDEAGIVDPLADGIDLSPFFDLMANEKVIKVFHSGRQDIEIVHNLSGRVPLPVFDTQIAAMVCGFGEQIGYADLMNRVLGISIDKTSRFSDWRRRPLHDHQLEYALGDVTHLNKAYPLLRERIAKAGRASWLDEEMAALVNPALYRQHPDDAWRRLKARNVKPAHLGILIELARWREQTAQKKNVPRNRVVKDDVIYEVANRAPASLEQLAGLRSITKGLARSPYARELLAGVERGLALDRASLPQIKRSRRLNGDALAIMELLKVLLKMISARHKVASKIIATMADLEQIALDDKADVPALRGWRLELFGKHALALKKGEIGLGLKNGSITTFSLKDQASLQ